MSLNKPVISEEGISGSDKICTLQPFEVLEIIDKPTPPPVDDPIDDKPTDDGNNLLEAPEDKSPISLIDWIIKILTYIKELLSK